MGQHRDDQWLREQLAIAQRERQALTELLLQVHNQQQQILTALGQTPAIATTPQPLASDRPPVGEPHYDFTHLDAQLQAQQWQGADQETARLCLQSCGQDATGYLEPSDLRRLSPQLLTEIDRRWRVASGGKFGFTVQKQKYQDRGGTKFPNEKLWQAFATETGWYGGDRWLTYDQLNFSLDAPSGHLPVGGDGVMWFIGAWSGGQKGFALVMNRIDRP